LSSVSAGPPLGNAALTGADTEPSPERGELRYVIIRSEREHLASQRTSADLDAGQAIVVPVGADQGAWVVCTVSV